MSEASSPETNSVDIRDLLKQNRAKAKMAFRVCAHCSLCADSCFLYHVHDGDPRYMPSHKMINSLGRFYKRKEKITPEELQEIQEIVWRRCVLCTRCYCPLGINIPDLISLTRQLCRSKDVFYQWDEAE